MTQTPETLTSSLDQLRRDREALDRMIEEQSLGVEFQPVVDLSTRAIVGYKALARGPEGTSMATPTGLLTSARTTGHLERLDWMFRAKAFDTFVESSVARGLDLYVKPEPETYGSPCPPRLAPAFGRAKRDLHVVVDIAERAFADLEQLRRGVAEFRGYGWRIAVEDVAGRSGALALLATIKPDVVKIDLSLPGRIGSTGVASVAAWVQEHGVALVVDGVDTPQALEAGKELGASAGRGSLLGRSSPSL